MENDADSLRQILREFPHSGWLEVSTCRYGSSRRLLGPGRLHHTRDAFAVLYLSRRLQMRVNGSATGPGAGSWAVLLGPESTWQVADAEGAAGDSPDDIAWLCLAPPVWRGKPSPAVVPGLGVVTDKGPMTWYQEQLSFLYHEHLDQRGEFRKGLCSALIHSVAAQIVLNASTLARPSYTRSDILQLCGEIRAHPARRFRLSELADMAGLSPRRLTRVFVTEVGKTPKEYEMRSRMAYAESLLANQGLNVRQAADACGYTDAFLFSRQFKEQTGRTPSSVRPGAARNSPREQGKPRGA